jgi:hypothetical protein
MKKLDDLNLIYSLLVSESRVAGTRKPNNCVKPRIVKGDLEAEVKGAFKPVDDPFSLSTWPSRLATKAAISSFALSTCCFHSSY